MGIESAELPNGKIKSHFDLVDIRKIAKKSDHPAWLLATLNQALDNIPSDNFEPQRKTNKTADRDTVKAHIEAEEFLKGINKDGKANQKVSFLHSPLNGEAAKGVVAAMKQLNRKYPEIFKQIKNFSSHDFSQSFLPNSPLAKARACSNLAKNDKSCGIYINSKRFLTKKEAMAATCEEFAKVIGTQIFCIKRLRKQCIKIFPKKIEADPLGGIVRTFTKAETGKRLSREEKNIMNFIESNFAQEPPDKKRQKSWIHWPSERAA